MQNKKVEIETVKEILKGIFELCIKDKTSPWLELKKACDTVKIEYPKTLRYFDCIATRKCGKIKEGDVLTFDRFNIELEDQQIYYFMLPHKNKTYEGWGQYNKTWDTITLISDDNKLDELIIEVKDIIICARLIQRTRDI